MAKMIPEKPIEISIGSREDEMFLALSKLPNEYYVFHSFVIVNTSDGIIHESETDFVIFHPQKGILCLESRCPKEELIEITLKDDVLKIDGNMAIAWSGSLDFTVERSGKTLIGSAASGEGLVNVYRGTGKVLLAPVTKGMV